MPILKTKIYDLSKDKEAQTIKTQLIVWSNVYHWRKYRWLSQSQLANNAEITQAIVSELEWGDYNPSIELLSKIAKALSIKIEYLTKEQFNRKFFEALAYFLSKVKDIDVLKAMKMIYFSDLKSYEILGYKTLWLDYFRRHAGPFNKDIYIMEDLFEKKWNTDKFQSKEYIKSFVDLSNNDLKFLDKIIRQYWNMTSSEIKEASYNTKPMEWIKIWDQKMMGKKVF
jgi:DNA-binding XRE family transcriptional regulator